MSAAPHQGLLSCSLATTRISSILLSRFILDLRSVYVTESNSGSGRMSSLRFASQFSGNIGAPLEEASTWTTNAADNEPEPMLFSDDPMAEVLTSRPTADPEGQYIRRSKRFPITCMQLTSDF